MNRNFEKRLRKVKARIDLKMDPSGFVPRSPEWCRFWSDWIRRRIAGEIPEQPITLEVYSDLMAIHDERLARAEAGLDSESST